MSCRPRVALLAPRGSYVLPSLTLRRAQVMGQHPPLHSLPLLSPSAARNQARPSGASSFFSKRKPPCSSPPPFSSCSAPAASHGRTAASHRGLGSSRLAVPCTEPGRRQQLGVAEPASRGLTTASSGRLPAHLVDRCTSTLACSSPTNSRPPPR